MNKWQEKQETEPGTKAFGKKLLPIILPGTEKRKDDLITFLLRFEKKVAA